MFVEPFLSTEVGGLMSYGARIADAMRQAVSRYLCQRHADSPVAQSSQFELVFNLQTTTMLALAVPPILPLPPTGDRIAVLFAAAR